MSSSFGRWYEEHKAAESGGGPSSSSSSSSVNNSSRFGISGFFSSTSGANTTTAGDDIESQALVAGGNSSSSSSLSGWKASLEAQMPQKVMGMNYQQRFRMFGALLILSALFFALGFTVGLTFLTIRPQKFALCFTFGSLTFMSSFAVLKGPHQHLAGMITPDRLPFTAVYIGSMLGTLYFTFRWGGPTGYALVVASSALQLLALVWYLITFLPGGSAGMKALTTVIYKMLKPVVLVCARMQAACVAKCFGWITSSASSSR